MTTDEFNREKLESLATVRERERERERELQSKEQKCGFIKLYFIN